MSKPRKRYDPMKAQLVKVRQFFKDMGWWYSAKDDSVFFIDYKNGIKYRWSNEAVELTERYRLKWTIHLIVIGHESNGKLRVTIDTKPLTNPMFRSDQILTDYLKEQHQLLIDSYVEKNKFSNACWLAVPNGEEVETSVIEMLIDKFKEE